MARLCQRGLKPTETFPVPWGFSEQSSAAVSCRALISCLALRHRKQSGWKKGYKLLKYQEMKEDMFGIPWTL